MPDLHQAAMETLSKGEFNNGDNQLSLLRDKVLTVGSEYELSLLMDYRLYRLYHSRQRLGRAPRLATTLDHDDRCRLDPEPCGPA